MNHSTFAEGVLPALRAIQHEEGLVLLVPSRLATTRSHAEHFRLRVTIPTRQGWKLLARKGRQVQEVLVVTSVSRERMEEITRIAESAVRAPKQKRNWGVEEK